MDPEEILEAVNSTSSANESTYYHFEATGTEIALECSKLLICLLGTSVDILMVFIIFKYKNMKKSVNIYLMNWLICDAIFVFIDPAEYLLYVIIEGLGAAREVICFLFTSIVIIRTLNVLFMIVLLLQWFFERTKIEIFERHCHKVAAGVWIFGLIEFLGFSCVSCMHEEAYSHWVDITALLLMLFLLICLSIVHCMRRCANPFNDSTSLSIALITSFILCWLCVITISLLYHIINHKMFIFLYYSGQIVVYLYPLFMFYLFYKLDAMFAVSVRILFRVTTPEEANTTFEELDEDKDDNDDESRTQA